MHSEDAFDRAEDVAAALLILLAFALFATEHLVHYPMGLMALLGTARMIRAGPRFHASDARLVLVLFGCIWLPMLIALIDAVDRSHSARKVFAYLHLLPAAWFVAEACARPRVLRLVSQGVAALLVFTGLDAFAQLIWKVDLFGYPYDDNILKGVFYPKQRLGLILAALAPVYIEVMRGWCRLFPRLWLVHVPMVIVLLMSLKRSAWLMLAVALTGYVVLVRSTARRSRSGLSMWHAGLIAAVIAVAVSFNPAFRAQVGNSVGLFSADFEQVDRASSYRLTLWRTGFDMFTDNWVNGVGPRGYRHAYLRYAAQDDFWVERSGAGQTHPHLLILEVAVESGALGLVGLLALYALVLRRLLAQRRQAGPLPWLLSALVAWLPVNAHLAFYGSYWSSLVWLLLAVGIGAGAAGADPLSPASSDSPDAPSG